MRSGDMYGNLNADGSVHVCDDRCTRYVGRTLVTTDHVLTPPCSPVTERVMRVEPLPESDPYRTAASRPPCDREECAELRREIEPMIVDCAKLRARVTFLEADVRALWRRRGRASEFVVGALVLAACALAWAVALGWLCPIGVK